MAVDLDDPPTRLATYHESRSAQLLHRGRYTEEGPTIARILDFIEARSTRRAAPARWNAILRQPVR